MEKTVKPELKRLLHTQQQHQPHTQTEQPPNGRRHFAQDQLGTIGRLGSEVQVKIPNRDHGHAVDHGVQAGHGRGTHPGQDQTGHPGRQLGDDEIGKHLGFAGRNVGRQLGGVKGVVGVEQASNQHEQVPR